MPKIKNWSLDYKSDSSDPSYTKIWKHDSAPYAVNIQQVGKSSYLIDVSKRVSSASINADTKLVTVEKIGSASSQEEANEMARTWMKNHPQGPKKVKNEKVLSIGKRPVGI